MISSIRRGSRETDSTKTAPALATADDLKWNCDQSLSCRTRFRWETDTNSPKGSKFFEKQFASIKLLSGSVRSCAENEKTAERSFRSSAVSIRSAKREGFSGSNRLRCSHFRRSVFVQEFTVGQGGLAAVPADEMFGRFSQDENRPITVVGLFVDVRSGSGGAQPIFTSPFRLQVVPIEGQSFPPSLVVDGVSWIMIESPIGNKVDVHCGC